MLNEIQQVAAHADLLYSEQEVEAAIDKMAETVVVRTFKRGFVAMAR